MFNRKTSVNGTKGIKRTGKAVAFIALFIMLTLVFTMYQTSAGKVEAAYQTATISGASSSASQGGWASGSDDETKDATGSITVSANNLKKAIDGGVMKVSASTTITSSTSSSDGDKSKTTARLYLGTTSTKSSMTQVNMLTSTSGNLSGSYTVPKNTYTIYVDVEVWSFADGSWGNSQKASCSCGTVTLSLETTDATKPTISAGGTYTTQSYFTIADSGAGVRGYTYDYSPMYGSTTASATNVGSESYYDTKSSSRSTSEKVDFAQGYGKYDITAYDNVGNSSIATIYYYNPQADITAVNESGTSYGSGKETSGGSVWVTASNLTTKANGSASERYNAKSTFYIHATPADGYYFAGFYGGASATTSSHGDEYNVKKVSGSISGDGGFYYAITMGEHRESSEIFYHFFAIFKEIKRDGGSWTQDEFKSGSTKTVKYDYTQYTINCETPTAAISGDDVYSIDSNIYGGKTAAGRNIGTSEAPRYAGSYTAQIKIKCGDTVVGQTATQYLTIDKREVTYTPNFEYTSRPYDGTSDAKITSWSTTTNLGDGFSVTHPEGAKYYSGESEVSDAGTGYTIKATGTPTANSTSDDINKSYTIKTANTSVSGEITRAELTLTGVTVKESKEYDGNTSHKITSRGSVSGAVNGEKITIGANSGTAVFGDKKVGTGKTVTVSGITISCSNKLTNYKLVASSWEVDGITYKISAKDLDNGGDVGNITCTASITKKSINNIDVTASGSKEYDATTAVTDKIKVTITSSDIVSGDKVEFSGSQSLDGADVGKHAVTVSNISILGEDAGNYSLITKTGTSGKDVSITHYAVTVTAKDESKTWGTKDPTTFTYTNTEVPDGDKGKTQGELFGLNAVREQGEVATEKVDEKYVQKSYKIYFKDHEKDTQITYGNYSIKLVTGTFTINKLTVTVSVNAGEYVYGATVDLTSKANLTFTPDGSVTLQKDFDAPDNEFPSFTIGDKPCVGTHTPKPIQDESARETMHQNYRYEVGTLNTITIKTATLTITYAGEKIEYGNDPKFALTYEGFKYDEKEADVFSTPPTITVATNEKGHIDVKDGGYSCTPAGGVVKTNTQGNQNYEVTYVSGTLTVTQRTLTSYFWGFGESKPTTDNPRVTSRPYDGTKPELKVYYVGFADNEDEGVLTTQSVASLNNSSGWPNAGGYKINVTAGNAQNYAVTAEAQIDITITKVTLTVTYVDEEIVYGETPVGALAYSGFVTYLKDGKEYTETVDDAFANDNAKPKVTTFASKINVGQHTYEPSGGSSTNYELSYKAGTLTVTEKDLAVTYTGNNVTYGEAPGMKFKYDGLVSGDLESALKVVVKKDIPIIAGEYSLGAEYFEVTDASEDNKIASNYEITIIEGKLIIGKKLLTVTPQTTQADYGEVKSDYKVPLAYEGFIDGENEDNALGFKKPDTNIPSVNEWGYVNRGSYELTPEGGEATNYNFTYNKGTLNVNKKALKITYPGETVTYNGTAIQQAVALVYDGFVDGEGLNNLTSDYFTPAMLQSNTNINVGTYKFTPYNAQAKNYEIEFVSGDFKISPVTITVGYAGESVVYGTDPVLTITYTGWLESLPEENTESMVKTKSALYYGETTTMPVDVGSYDLTLSEAECVNGNYVFKYVNGTLTITQKTLTVKFQDETLGYGDVHKVGDELVFPWTPVYSGFERGDDESALANKPIVPAPESFNQGTYTITPICEGEYTAENSERNYKYEFVAGTLTITQKVITVTYASDVKDYGAVGEGYDFMGRISYQGVATVMGDTEDSVLDKTGVTLTGTPTQNARGYFDAGVYTIVPEGLKLKSDNYKITEETYYSGTLTVNKVNLTVYVEEYDIAYDDFETLKASDFTLNYSGFVGGEDQTVLDVLPTVDVSKIEKEVGFQTVTPVMTGGVDPLTADTNYNIILVGRANNFNIYKAGFDMSSVVFKSAEFTYDGTKHSIYIADGIIDNIIKEQVTKDGAKLPEGQTITAHYTNNEQRYVSDEPYEVTLYFTHNISGYKRISEKFTAYIKINPCEINYVVDDALLSEIYGNEDKTLTGTPSWKAVDDNLNAEITLPAYTENYRQVGDYGIFASYNNKNYNITFKTNKGISLSEAKYTVTPRNVEVKLLDQSAEYNGNIETNVAQTEYEVTSELKIMDGDDIGIAIAIESADKYIVRDGGYELTGSYNNSSNYSVTFVPAKFDITKAELNLTLTAQSYTYDGTEAVLAQTAYAFGEGEVKSGDVLTPEIIYKESGEHVHVAYAKDGSVAGYPITATLADGNYNIHITDSIMTVNKRPATLTVSTQEYVYGEVRPLDQNAYVTEGVVEGDSLGVVLSRQGSAIVGEYEIYASTNNRDYDVTVKNGIFRITKRQANLDASRINGAEYVYVAGGVYIKADSVRYAIHDNTDIANTMVGITYPSEPLNAGKHEVTLSVNETQNYLGASVTVTVYVRKATTVINTSLIESTKYTFTGAEQTINGATFNNTDPDAELTYNNNVFTEVPENGYLNVTISSPETDNYTAGEVTISVTINRAVMNFVNYEFRTNAVTYDGTDHVVSASGVPEGVGVKYIYNEEESDTPFKFRNAGTYTVSLRFEYDSKNYASPSVGTEATLSIHRASITVKANDLTGQYGDEVVFTDADYSIIQGTVYGDDDIGVKISTERVIREIGRYTLSATASNPNYNIVVDAGSYTITTRKLTIKFDDILALYGDSEHKFTYTVTEGSILEGDTIAVVAQREPGKSVGKYQISGTADNPLYDIEVVSGEYNISKRPLTIIVNAQTGTSSRDLKDDRFTLEGGIVAGDDLDISVVGEIGSEPGAYTLSATYADNENYEITVVNSVFDLVRLAKITVGSDLYRKIYDGIPVIPEVSINSGAELKFTVRGSSVHNSFTEIGSYEVVVSADAVEGYSAPASVTFYVEICPVRLTAEIDGLIFAIDNSEGFNPDDKLVIERNEESSLSNAEFMQQLNGAYKFVIESDGINYTVGEYFNGSDVDLKVKPTEELQNSKNFASYVVDSEGQKVADASYEVDEDGFITISAVSGESVYFVSERENVVPILIIVCALVFSATILMIFMIFRRKA